MISTSGTIVASHPQVSAVLLYTEGTLCCLFTESRTYQILQKDVAEVFAETTQRAAEVTVSTARHPCVCCVKKKSDVECQTSRQLICSTYVTLISLQR